MKPRLLLLIFIASAFLATSPLYAQEEPVGEQPPLGLSTGIDYWSTYFWRGSDMYGSGEGVIFPWISYDVAETGLSLTVSGENPMEMLGDGVDRETDGWNGLDLGATYSYSIENTVTFGANAWFWWYYVSKDKLTNDAGQAYNASFWSLTGSVTLDMINVMTPTISYTHDLYMDKKATDNNERFQDFYIQLSLAQSFELTGESALEFKLFGSFFNYKSKEGRGISDLGVSAKVSTEVGIVTLYGQMNYAFVPDGDFYKIDDGAGGTENDKHHWWAAVGISCGI